MAHLKKFSLAKKLHRIQDNTPKVYTPLLFAQGDDDCLFYSAERMLKLTQTKRKQIMNLCHTMHLLEIPYLSANQVGLEERFFTMQLQKNNFKWSLLGEEEFEKLICINPIVQGTSQTTNLDWETNICFPFLRCQVERYDRIKVAFTELEDDNEIELDGFNARIIQSALDSLNGYQIIDPRLNLGRWEINPKWKNVLPKTELTIATYRADIQKLVKTNPECFAMRSVKELNTRFKEEDDEFSFEAVMMKRFEKYIKREMLEPAAATFEGSLKEDVLEKLKV